MPSIVIYKDTLLKDKILNQILYGIEEEGIPFLIEEKVLNDIVKSSYEASLSSALSVGIALNDKMFVLHYSNLPEEKPLLSYNVRDMSLNHARNSGLNAARLVKSIPFVFEAED